jgi:hypothetical protein
MHYTPRFHKQSSATTKNIQVLAWSCNRVRMHFLFISSFRTTFSLVAPISLPVYIHVTNIIKDILKIPLLLCTEFLIYFAFYLPTVGIGNERPSLTKLLFEFKSNMLSVPRIWFIKQCACYTPLKMAPLVSPVVWSRLCKQHLRQLAPVSQSSLAWPLPYVQSDFSVAT